MVAFDHGDVLANSLLVKGGSYLDFFAHARASSRSLVACSARILMPIGLKVMVTTPRFAVVVNLFDNNLYQADLVAERQRFPDWIEGGHRGRYVLLGKQVVANRFDVA